ncbi:MAG: cellulase family glycosylhydrolase [Candidatus Dormibacteraeota bacterium]|nr:cellulase family glycosylhydrolase [Candidatus Dormibacteraeota bacterium]MBV9525488.1 cellulase family glycosylhydrolase [Candidatus Dormibacteraeota bacterium]
MRRLLPLLALLAALLPGNVRASTLALHVSGSHFVDGSGNVVQLRGSTRSGAEYACWHGNFEDGPWDQTAVDAMAAWHFNVVRLPLDEACWLGINGLPAAGGELHGSAAQYQQDVHTYVQEIERDGMYVILDNRDAAPGGAAPSLSAVMADADHAPAFFASLAASFRDDPAVLFDLYNEPNRLPGTDQQQMACVRDGCAVTDPKLGSYQSAGEQSLLDAIRGAGASQVVLESSPSWSADPRYWTQYVVNDPLHQVAATVHPYDVSYWLHNPPQWAAELGAILNAGYPVVATETGSHDCQSAWIDGFMTWADTAGVSYLPFGWQPWGCTMPSLISDWSGTPTPAYGMAVRVHLGTQVTPGPIVGGGVSQTRSGSTSTGSASTGARANGLDASANSPRWPLHLR